MITTKQLSEKLDLSDTSIHLAVQAGEIPMPERHGFMHLWEEKQIVRWASDALSADTAIPRSWSTFDEVPRLVSFRAAADIVTRQTGLSVEKAQDWLYARGPRAGGYKLITAHDGRSRALWRWIPSEVYDAVAEIAPPAETHETSPRTLPGLGLPPDAPLARIEAHARAMMSAAAKILAEVASTRP